MVSYRVETEEWWHSLGQRQHNAPGRVSQATAACVPEEVLARLILPPLSESHSGGLRLSIELVPRSSWAQNVRSVVSKGTWDQIRTATCRACGWRCTICGAAGRLSCHERWAYDDQTATQTLEGFVALCSMCHWVKHIGLAGVLARAGQLDYQAVVRHFLAVNACDEETFEEHRAETFEVWRRRSERRWTVDLGPLTALLREKHEGGARHDR